MNGITSRQPIITIWCILAILLTGCAHGSPAPTATASPIAPKQLPLIGVSLPNVETTDMTLIQKGMADNQRKSDVSLLYRSADGKAEKQASDIGDLVRLNVVGLIVLPVDATLIAPAIEAVRAKGIPVIAIDTPPTGIAVDSLVRSNYRANGREAAKFVTDKLPARGTALILARATTRGEDFSAGVQEGMAKVFATVQTATINDPQEVAGIVIPAVHDGDVRTIIAGDDAFALAAVDTLKGAGLLSGVTVIGQGGTRDAIRAILDGTLTGDMDTRPQDLGVAAVNGIAALVRKKQPSFDVIVRINGVDIPVTAVTGRLITRDNVRDMQERWPNLVYTTPATLTPTRKP